ncbi:CerR family C-terminal domain-containing protein [Rhodopirellula sp. P2]|uniref:CerR family C-terminal domain-containing protein n=1 Tax=Rhodopirellula sp. P2 TaxID=2127060 RepID=UPI002367E021|nr:CerR family C-terminal domain-containing protein [Rhodopirellula sp. P2]WDQ16182.1 CerR family C-terminal domain-containing protein [Rhodopirellula sp. P2]
MTESPAPATTDPTQRLLAAAGPVFAERGFDRATVREIANVADVNVAAVSYYFGDKMGLYRAVITAIREKRERAYPTPEVGKQTPPQDLERLIRTLLSRMLAADETGWEAMLMMREMQNPTPAFEGMIHGYFQPLYDALCKTIQSLLPSLDSKSAWQTDALVPQMALGVVGQCLHYRIGRPVMAHLISPELIQTHYGLDSLCSQITASTLAACGDQNVIDQHKLLFPSPLNEPHDVSCQQ